MYMVPPKARPSPGAYTFTMRTEFDVAEIPLKSVLNSPLTFSLPRLSNITDDIFAAETPGTVSFITLITALKLSRLELPLPTITKADAS